MLLILHLLYCQNSIDLASAIKAYAKTSKKMSDHVGSVLDFGANLKHKIMSDVSAVLVQGLGRRVRLVALEPENPVKVRKAALSLCLETTSV